MIKRLGEKFKIGGKKLLKPGPSEKNRRFPEPFKGAMYILILRIYLPDFLSVRHVAAQ